MTITQELIQKIEQINKKLAQGEGLTPDDHETLLIHQLIMTESSKKGA